MVIEALLPTLALVATDHTVGDIPAAIDFGLGSPATVVGTAACSSMQASPWKDADAMTAPSAAGQGH
jgi:hypothetical protein